MAEPIIELDRVGIRFAKTRRRRLKLGEALKPGRKRERPKGTFWALRDVSFTVQPGEGVGVVGANGMGKSTLLKLIAGVLIPDEGSVTVRGGASLLEVRAGMSKDLTGRENVYLIGALHGLPQKVLDKRFDEIIRFAELEEFADTPIRHYSDGMQARLGFSVASLLEEPILLVDEAFAVGDRDFRKKCYTRLERMLADGRTLVLVSHNEPDLERFCERGLYLERGSLVVDGSLEEALEAYNAADEQGKPSEP